MYKVFKFCYKSHPSAKTGNYYVKSSSIDCTLLRSTFGAENVSAHSRIINDIKSKDNHKICTRVAVSLLKDMCELRVTDTNS